jgi:hypothetical protein
MERGIRSRTVSYAALLGALAMTTSGCELVKGIFKAGVWVGVLAILALVAVVALAMRLVKR